MERAGIRIKTTRTRLGGRARAGETLVETVVAFSVVLLMLASVTFMLRFALNENSRALQRMEALQAAETEVEKGLGTVSGAGTLSVGVSGYGSASIPITIKESGELMYFAD